MRRFLKFLTFLIGIPFGLLIGTFLAIAAFAIVVPMSIRERFQYRQWVQKMRSKGRVRDASAIVHNNESGTLIVDRPKWGESLKHCWWTPDDVASLAPFDIIPLSDRIDALRFEIQGDGFDLPLDRWIYEHYLSDDSGTAILVSTRNSDKIAECLTRKLPGLKIVETWTAPCSEFGPSKDKPEIDGPPSGPECGN